MAMMMMPRAAAPRRQMLPPPRWSGEPRLRWLLVQNQPGKGAWQPASAAVFPIPKAGVGLGCSRQALLQLALAAGSTTGAPCAARPACPARPWLSCRMDDSEDHLVAHVLGGGSTAAVPAVPAEQVQGEEELAGLDLAALASADLPQHVPAAAPPPGPPSPAHSAA